MKNKLVVAMCALLLSQASVADPAALSADPALANTFKDASLKWGPCPPFIPAGCQIAVLHGDPGKANSEDRKSVV